MNPCVLLVDDEPRNLLALEALLQPLGHRLVRAHDAIEAMKIFEELHPDLVITDLMMPRYDGVALLGMIRAHPDYNETPVILVTAHGERAQRLRALQAGADEFVEKPIDAAFLITRVNNLLRLQHAKKALVAQRDELQASRRERRELTEFMLRDVKGALGQVCVGLAVLSNELERGPAPLNEAVGQIESDARRVNEMLEDLLWITRLEHLSFPLQTRALSLDEEVGRSVLHVADVAKRKRVAIETASSAAITVDADERLLARVIDNLLANALRHAPEGGHVLIELSAGEHVEICVHNDGAQVPAIERERIFGKFVRGATEPPYSCHAGLGLYFCKCAMTAMRGDIQVVDRPDWSTSFLARLPANASRSIAA